jgi:hypothetical protein
MTQRTFSLLLASAFCFTLLNALKPLTIDDAAYYQYALHMKEHPLDPYGFEAFWGQTPAPAHTILAPPVLPYWWSLILHVSDTPFIWKLWLLPFAVLLTFSLYALLRRFAGDRELPLTLLLLFSPAFLPGFNLMLDVPALALELFALTLFFSAAEKKSLRCAVLSGLLLGIAIQTKYIAFLGIPVVLLHAALFRRWRHAIVVASLALMLFLGWEMFIAWTYGASHFLSQLSRVDGGLLEKVRFLWPLLLMSGGVLSPFILLHLALLRLRRSLLLSAASLLLLGYLLIAILEIGVVLGIGIYHGLLSVLLSFSAPHLIFGIFGATLLVLTVRSFFRRQQSFSQKDFFLFCWLLLEVAGYFFMNPFPAVRRIMGISVVLLIILGRFLTQEFSKEHASFSLRPILLFTIFLGILFYGIDFQDANAAKKAVGQATTLIEEHSNETIWYTGHWGFQFYAERAGMRAVIPGKSLLKEGDWLVTPDARYEQQRISLSLPELMREAEIPIGDRIPLRTVMAYYSGDVPLEHHDGPRITVTVSRVRGDVIPQ